MQIWELIRDNCCGDVEFTHDYSGRGMYGDKCAGIVGDMRYCMQVIADCIKSVYTDGDEDTDPDEVVDMLLNFRQDSMGRDVIVYWENISCDGQPEDDEEG